MRPRNRRDFLQDLPVIAAGGCLAVGILGKPLGAKEPRMDFPAAPRDRISLTSYPFRAYIESPGNKARDPRLPGMTLEQFAATAAGKFGVRGELYP